MGLTLGMGGALLLLLNIWFEYSIDQFHTKKDRIYKVYYLEMLNGRQECTEAEDPSLAPSLPESIPIDQRQHPDILYRKNIFPWRYTNKIYRVLCRSGLSEHIQFPTKRRQRRSCP